MTPARVAGPQGRTRTRLTRARILEAARRELGRDRPGAADGRGGGGPPAPRRPTRATATPPLRALPAAVLSLAAVACAGAAVAAG